MKIGSLAQSERRVIRKDLPRQQGAHVNSGQERLKAKYRNLCNRQRRLIEHGRDLPTADLLELNRLCAALLEKPSNDN